ncbi:MAG: hypothetical protein ACRDHG_05030 [Anaerolineales bacterium]
MTLTNANLTASQPSLDKRLLIARVAWVAVTGLVVGLIVLGVLGLYARLFAGVDERSVTDLGWTRAGYSTYVTGLYLLVVAAHLIIGAIVFWRRSDEWIALALAFALVCNGALIPLSLIYHSGNASPVVQLLVGLVTYIGLVTGLSLLYLFPDGRFIPRWTRFMVVSWAGLLLFAIFLPNSALSMASWPIPLQLLVLMVWSGVGLFAQLHRYLEVSSPLQRQQTKWAILGLGLAVLGPFGYFLPFVILPALSDPEVPNILYQRIGPSLFAFSLVFRLLGITAFTLALLIFPASFVVAILRYRLWDIDVIINRTLVYAALTGTLALVYLIGVALLQGVFRGLTGLGDQIAIVATTLGIAGMFNPLRRRIQAVIDRRFYRKRYDAARALAAFSGAVQEELELEDVSLALLRVVEETVQPLQTSIWLREIRPGS